MLASLLTLAAATFALLGNAQAQTTAAPMAQPGAAALPSTSLLGLDIVNRERLVELSGSVLRIEAARAQGGYGFGSGVVLPGQRIVTNCHVTRDAQAVYVTRGGARWKAQAQAAAPELDVCVLHVPDMVAPPVALAADGRLRVGQPVAALGYMGGMPKPSVSDGYVMDLNRHAGGDVIQASTGFISGASGGGLFDTDGALAGILTFRLRGGDSHYFAAPVAWLAPLLADTSLFRPVAPLKGVELPYWERGAESQPRFLRAVSMAHGGLWDRLLGLASTWSNEDAQNPHGHYWRGLALGRLARLDDAEAALGHANQLAPLWAAPLEALGLLHLQRQRPADAHRILERLQSLRKGAGDKLRLALQRCADQPAKTSCTS